MTAKAGDTVKVHYTGKLDDGQIFDSSEGSDALELTIGGGNMIEGFDAAVRGMLAEYRLLADYLDRQSLRYGTAPFWDAYAVAFLTDERVRLASSDLVRVEEYGRLLERHRDSAIVVSSSRCEGPRVARWWVCTSRPR